jgi:hypothetical protein
VTLLFTWEASAPGVKGSGVSSDEDAACRAAQEWMQDNGARVARLELVELVVGAASLVPTYRPTGAVWHVTVGEHVIAGDVRRDAAVSQPARPTH